MSPGRDVVPLSIDLSAMVRRSVATLYSHLVTRPTGQALRLGIESQIGEVRGPCLSVLDFRQVVIMDYSCADEAIAKLLQRYLVGKDVDEVYFVARGVGERHLDTIDAVLERHGLALVAELEDAVVELLGPVSEREQELWSELQRRGRAAPASLAGPTAEVAEVERVLDALAERRLVLRAAGTPVVYVALSSLLPPTAPLAE